MPRISVVVPIYNVERYLAECLESLAQQSERDLEVIMVDDGSTDSSATIAKEFAERDSRFQLVQQPNGGLGHARNTGADRATGDYIAFVDSDDVVTPNTYELMAHTLDETGSDFATGNFHRLTTAGTRQAGMVTTVYQATRLKTHITKHPALLNDRTAWNKLFRRSFWTRHGFRWPEGVLYEDIPVTLPAHVLARSVDVLRQPIYLWRARVGDATSITQRRVEPRAIRDRYTAVDGVSRFLAERDERDLKERYDRSCAEQDLSYFLNQLDDADDDFRELFLELVNDFFDRASPHVFDKLPAIDRLKWHLVRRRLMPELLEVLRFQKSGEIAWRPVIRRGRRFYGDYPFRADSALAIPESIYRLDRDELPVRASIEDVWWDGETLRLRGYAHIAFLEASKPGAARIRLTLEESGHPESVVALSVQTVQRPDVTAAAPDGRNYDWSGFEASLPAAALRHRRRFRDGQWRLRVEVRTDGITRRRWLSVTEAGRAQRPGLVAIDGARIVPTTEAGNFGVQVSARPAVVETVRLDGSVIELHGQLHGRTIDPATAHVRVARDDGTAALVFPVAPVVAGDRSGVGFVTRIATADLRGDGVADRAAHAEDRGDGVAWSVTLLPSQDAPRVPLAAAEGLDEPRLQRDDLEVLLLPDRMGRLRIIERRVRPEIDGVAWASDGAVEIEGRYPEPQRVPSELVLVEATDETEHTVAMTRDADRFRVRIDPVALPAGQWDLYARALSGGEPVRVKVARDRLRLLPCPHPDDNKRIAVVDVDYDSVALLVGLDRPVSKTGRSLMPVTARARRGHSG